MTQSSVMVVDGYGISLNVHRGDLVVADGVGRARVTRMLSRTDRTIRRIVVLADTGQVSLEAVRWCADLDITLVQIDREARLLLLAGAEGIDDPRLRRAQAAASTSDTGVGIARALLLAKLRGQASVLQQHFEAALPASRIDTLSALLPTAPLATCRDLEAQASNVYFGAWAGHATARFAEREVSRVPEAWIAPFAVRRSPVAGGRSSRSATTPINALLNYGYTLAEVEARIALLRVGLDPGLGIVHTDKRDRDSLALDLLEPLRPVVERQVLDLVARRHFRADDFYQTRQGVCRVLAPLTQALSDLGQVFAAAVGPWAEMVAHSLAHSSPGLIQLTTPLTRERTRATTVQSTVTKKRTSDPTTAVAGTDTCAGCGKDLYVRGRKYCTSCWPVHRNALFAATGARTLDRRRQSGTDTSHALEARDRRHKSLLVTKAAEAAWAASESVPSLTEQRLHQEVIPGLANVTLRQIQEVTGLSNASASRIRRGLMTPHPRHWEKLDRLAVGQSI